MLEDLVPPGVVVAEAAVPFATTRDDAAFDAEKAVVTAACPTRQREFLVGRALARRAIKRLGHGPTALLQDDAGCCIWPQGLVGSISHTRSRCAVAVARGTQVQALGIDLEDVQTLSDGVVRAITRSNEVIPDADLDERAWHLLRFSAKEAVFKAWFSDRRMWLDFQDVTVTFEPPSGAVTIGTFLATIRPVAEHTAVTYSGRYGMHRSGYVATAAVADTCQLWAARERRR